MVSVGGLAGGGLSEPILAGCTKCGLPFVAGTIGPGGMTLGHGQNVYIGHLTTGPGSATMQGVQVQCSRCGSMGRVPDGVYGYVRRSRKVLRQITPEQSAAMLGAIRRYQSGQADEAEVEAATPEVARPFVLETLKKADKKYWLTILIAVLVFLAQWRMSDDSTQQVEQKVTAAARQQTEQDQQVEECIAESDGSDRCRARPVSRVFDNTINFRCRAEVGQERPLLVWLRQQVQALSRGQLVNVKSEVRRWTPGLPPAPKRLCPQLINATPD